MVPGFNEEVKFYKRVTHEGGAIETEPTTLDEIMEMDITMVLPPQPQSRRESELTEPQARGRVCGGDCRQAAAHRPLNSHYTHITHIHIHIKRDTSHIHSRVYCKYCVPVL